MSSKYHPICLSHDPGIVLDHELTSREVSGFTRGDIPDHANCDIVIGRFSYPLVEVACLGRQLPGSTGCKGHHTSPDWTDSAWLRLLAAAATSTVPPEALQPLLRCWPLERLSRLHGELGLTIPHRPAPPAAESASPAAPAQPDQTLRLTWEGSMSWTKDTFTLPLAADDGTIRTLGLSARQAVCLHDYIRLIINQGAVGTTPGVGRG